MVIFPGKHFSSIILLVIFKHCIGTLLGSDIISYIVHLSIQWA